MRQIWGQNPNLCAEVRVSRYLPAVTSFSYTSPEMAKPVSIVFVSSDESYREQGFLLVRTQFYCDWNNERTTVILWLPQHKADLCERRVR